MKNLTLLPISIALSILFYLFFLYTVPDYYGVAIFLFQLLFLVSLIHFKTTDTLAPQAALLIASTIILSGWFTIFTHPVIGVVNMLLLILVNLFLVTEIAGSSKDLSATFFGSLAQRLSFIPIWMDSIEPSLKNAKQSITIPNLLTSHKAVVREALISIGILVGILIVVIPLLSAADLGFAKVMQSVFDVFRIDGLSGILSFLRKIVVIGGVWLAMWSLYYAMNTFVFSQEKTENTKVYTISNHRMVIILGGVNIIYAIFVAVQFAFLFSGNHAAIVERGIDSYATYIHRGFWQLIFIAFINGGLYYIFKKKDTKTIGRIMLVILCVFTGVMLVSALMRIVMYVEAYGLTFLRSLVIYAIDSIACINLYLIIRIYTKKSDIIGMGIGIAGSMRLIFGYINIDARIASYNIHAYQSLPANYEKNRKDYGPFKKSTSLDTRYLFTLSADAAIPLLSLQKKGLLDERGEHLLINKYFGNMGKKEVVWYHWNYHYAQMKAYDGIAKSSIN